MRHLESDPWTDWAHRVNSSLRDRSTSLATFRRYLVGDGTPAFDRSTEDHEWLLEAIRPRGLDRQLLSSLSRDVLERDFGSSQLPPVPRFVHNLLSLCAGLRMAEVLAAPLIRIYRQRLLPEAGAPNSEYRGVPLVADLCMGLIFNQKDSSLTEDWVELLTFWPDKPHYLAETPMAGFDGVLGLPGAPRPALIALALREMSRFLDDSPDRVDQFKRLLKRVRTRYTGYDLELNHPYLHFEWKPWAIKLIRAKQVVQIAHGQADDFTGGARQFKLTIRSSPSRSKLKIDSVRNAAYDVSFHHRRGAIGKHGIRFVKDQLAATASAK